MPKITSTNDRYAPRFDQLRRELQNLQYFCKGTVLERRMKCGQPNCACQRDPTKRHGPYWEWTYKVAGKTVNVKLTPSAGPLYKAGARQYRNLKSLINRLEQLSHKALALQAKQAQAKNTTSG